MIKGHGLHEAFNDPVHIFLISNNILCLTDSVQVFPTSLFRINVFYIMICTSACLLNESLLQPMQKTEPVPSTARVGGATLTTPTANSVPYATFDPALLGVGKYAASGYKWGGSTLGTGVVLSFSFPTGTACHDASYGNEWCSWFSMNSLERSAVRSVLGTWSRFATINSFEPTETQIMVANLRFAFSTALTAKKAALAYSPSCIRPQAMFGSIRATSTVMAAAFLPAPTIS